MNPEVEWQLGEDLRTARLWYLPDVGRDAGLIGTQFWRVVGPHVELIRLRPNGLALASRTWADFDYARPTEHGAVIEARRGEATNMLTWLLDTSEFGAPP